MGTSWISYRKKHELEAVLLELGLDQGGTVEEQRTRLYAFIRQPDLPADTLTKLGKMEVKYGNAPSGDTKPLSPLPAGREDGPSTSHSLTIPRSVSPGRRGKSEGPTEPPVTARTNASQLDASICSILLDKVTRWGLSFDGSTDPLSFVEHMEERADTYRVDRRYLSQAIAILLTGRAESWFRTSGLQGRGWEETRREFLDFFLPPRYYQRLEDEIRAHFQKANEPFKEYLVDIRLQMRRAGFTGEQELDRVYENMLPEYQMFTRRQDFTTLAELTHLVVSFEAARSRGGRTVRGYSSGRTEAETSMNNPQPRNRASPRNTIVAEVPRSGNRSQSSAPREGFDASTACRNCGQSGHFSSGCQNPRVLFCWDCGRQGLRTIDCCRNSAPGNERGPRVSGSYPRNPPASQTQ